MVHERHEKILFKDECYLIQGAIFEVYREMGCGFLESVYQECLEKELSKRGIPFVAQQETSINIQRRSASTNLQARSDLLWSNYC